MKKIFTLALLAAFALVSCTPNSKDPVDPYPEACDKHDLDLITTEVAGIYYHDTITGTSYDYGVVLSNQTTVYDIYTGGVDLKPEQTYLFLDIYSDTAAPNYSVSFKLPNGTYTLDLENSGAAGTVGAEYTELIIINADNEAEEIFFASGTVTVTDHIIDAVLIGEDGKVYHVQSVNKTVDNTNSWGEIHANGETTTLTGDHAVNFSAEPYVYLENYGDYLILNKNFWEVYISDEASFHEFYLAVLADPAKELPVGTFPVSGDLSKEVMLPGYADAFYGMTAGAWMVQYTEDSEMAALAALKSGDFTIAIEGENVTITVNAVDEAGHKITGTCTAPYELGGESGWSLNKLSTGAKFAKHAKKQLAPRKVKFSSMIKK